MVYIKKLIWTAWNREHVTKHGVTVNEFIEVCESKYTEKRSYKNRIVLIGQPKKAERVITVVIEPVSNDEYFPLSSRPASKKERKIYIDDKGGEKAA